MNRNFQIGLVIFARSRSITKMRRFLAIAACSLLILAHPGGAQEPSPGLLTQIKERGYIQIGVQEEYRPFRIERAKPGYPGIDMELGQALADAIGVEAHFMPMPLDRLLEEAGSGKIDVALGGISSSLERARTVNFTEPYMTTTSAALLSRDALPPESESVNYSRRQVKSLADLKYLGSLTIGVRAGTTNAALVSSDPEFKKHKVKTYRDRTVALSALESREIDILVADDVYLRALLLRRPELMTRFLPLLDTYVEDHISMALPRGQAEWWNYLNFFVKEMKRTGRMQTIAKKYLESGAWF